MSEKRIYKPRPVSGFPEWLPEVRRVEQMWLDRIRATFESYGYASIETPAVEELAVIEAKGGDGGADVDKEVYVLERLHKEESDKEARLALHFDQTVPLARYVAQRFNELDFPFKRYQMQKVWRGERPQAGRFREFYQCDIDVINPDNLPLHFDAEMPAIIWEILSSLPGMENEKIQIQISHRKILLGLLAAMHISQTDEILHIVDKRDKLGAEEVSRLLKALGLANDKIEEIVKLSSIQTSDPNIILEYALDVQARARASDGIQSMLDGAKDLKFILEYLQYLPKGAVVADLSIVRGLDYYTGIVYETRLLDDPGYGSICSGGRYDDLASNYINKKLPGVGISIGFSRLFDRLYKQGKFDAYLARKTPTDILVVLPSEERRAFANETAQALRARGLNVELYHAPRKIPDQMKYASKKGIPYVWFPPFEDGKDHEVKNMASGEQAKADPKIWKP